MRKLKWECSNKHQTIYKAMWFVIVLEVFQNEHGFWGYCITGQWQIFGDTFYGSKETAMEQAEDRVFAEAEILADDTSDD